MDPITSHTPQPPDPTPPSNTGTHDWPHPDFTRNRSQVPLDELRKWVGKHVAWNWEGTRIVAGAETPEGLIDELRRAGVDPGHVVFGYVDDPGVSWL